MVQQGSHTGAQVVTQQGSHTGVQQVVGQQHALRHRRLCPASASQPDATTATQVSVPTKQRSRVFLPIIVEPLESLGGETGRTQRGPTFPRAGNGRPAAAAEASCEAGPGPQRGAGQGAETAMIFAGQRPRGRRRPASPLPARQFAEPLSRPCDSRPARRCDRGRRHRADAPGRRSRPPPRRGLRGSRGGPCRRHPPDHRRSICPPPRS